MKKFIPYIFITAFIGTFLAVSFIGPFSSTVSGPKKAEAGLGTEVLKFIGVQALSMLPIFAVTDLVGITDTTKWGDWGAIGDASIGKVLAWTSSFTWYVSSRIYTLSGYLLDYSVDFSIKDFKKNTDSIAVIKIGYGIILNVVNMIFIFILLYIAIKMILGMGGDVKKLLTNVILVALFVNFSLFMSKVLIDASNIVAMGFYNAVQTDMGEVAIESPDKGKTMIAVGSISTSMQSGLRLQTLLPSQTSEFNKTDSAKGLTNFNIAMNQFGGSAMYLVTAFVFFAVSFLFITRFIALLFYMLFSPVAFLGYISPELKEHSSKWWKGFQNQLIFAPVFLFIAYLISSIINSGQLWAAVGGEGNPSATMYDAISSAGQAGSFSIIMNYVILIALMIGGLITAKAMAAQGSAGMVAYADKARGWMQGVAGRNTIGRAAYLANKSGFVNNLAAKSPTFGGFAKKILKGGEKLEFGGAKGGFAKQQKDSVKQKKEIADEIAKSKVSQTEKAIRENLTLIDERKMREYELENEKLKSKEQISNWENEYGKYDKNNYDNLMAVFEKSRKEYGKLVDIASKTMNADDFKHANIAHEEMQRDEANLENERIKLQRQGADMVRYDDAKLNFAKDEEKLEEHKRNTEEIQNKLNSLTKVRENIRNKMKSEYAKNLPWVSLGKSLGFGKNFAFLDNIFPSYTDAADEIRKVKDESVELAKKVLKDKKVTVHTKEGEDVEEEVKQEKKS